MKNISFSLCVIFCMASSTFGLDQHVDAKQETSLQKQRVSYDVNDQDLVYLRDRKGVVHILNVATKKEVQRFHFKDLSSKLYFTKDGRHILGLNTGTEKKLIILESQTFNLVSKIPYIDYFHHPNLLLSEDGKYAFIFCSYTKFIVRVNLQDKTSQKIDLPFKLLNEIIFAPNGQQIIVNCQLLDLTTKICTVDLRETPPKIIKESTNLFPGITTGYNNQNIFVANNMRDNIKIMNFDSLEMIKELPTTGDVRWSQYSEDCQNAFFYTDESIFIFNLKTMREEFRFKPGYLVKTYLSSLSLNNKYIFAILDKKILAINRLTHETKYINVAMELMDVFSYAPKYLPNAAIQLNLWQRKNRNQLTDIAIQTSFT